MAKKIYINTESIRTSNNVPLSKIDSVVGNSGLSLTAKTNNVTISSSGEISVKDTSNLKLTNSSNQILSTNTNNPYVSLFDDNISVGKVQITGGNNITVSGSGSTITISGTEGSTASNPAIISKAVNSPTVTLTGGGSGGVTFYAGEGIELDTSAANKVTISNTHDSIFGLGSWRQDSLASPDLNNYLVPGNYRIFRSSGSWTNCPAGDNNTTYPGLLTVKKITDTQIYQFWRYNNSYTSSSVNALSALASYGYQRYLYVGANKDGQDTLTAAGDWVPIGIPAMSTSAPTRGAVKGRFWFNTNTGQFHIYNGTAWEEVGNNMSVSIQNIAPSTNLINGRTLWIDPDNHKLSLYYNNGWINFVNP